jgi:hypothetical protein
LQSEPLRKPKFSKELLNLRKIQQTLAKQKEYAEAHKIKLKADNLEVNLNLHLIQTSASTLRLAYYSS